VRNLHSDRTILAAKRKMHDVEYTMRRFHDLTERVSATSPEGKEVLRLYARALKLEKRILVRFTKIIEHQDETLAMDQPVKWLWNLTRTLHRTLGKAQYVLYNLHPWKF
jgi:hypothetical protein